jgi:hypothetical protein
MSKSLKLAVHGVLILPLIFGFFDLLAIYYSGYEYSMTKYVQLSLSEGLRWLALCGAFYITGLSSFTLFCRNWSGHEKQNRRFPSFGIKNANSIFRFIFFSIAVYKIVFILNFGVVGFSIGARQGDIPIGHALYFVLLMFPFVLAYDVQANGFNLFVKVALLALVFLNLATGFRGLLVWGIIIITFFNIERIFRIGFKKLATAALCIGVVFVGYEGFRESIASGIVSDRALIDSLNRTNVLSYMKLIDEKEVFVGFKAVLKMWTDPFFVFVRSLGAPTDTLVNVFYFRDEIYAPLFEDYLAWRGTPNAVVGGFSLGIISWSFLFGKYLGVLVFGLFYGWFLAVGAKLMDTNIYEKRLFGLVLVSGCFWANESVLEATRSVVYSLVFVGAMFVMVLTIQMTPLTLRTKRNLHIKGN